MAGMGPPPKEAKHGRTPNLGSEVEPAGLEGVPAPDLPNPKKWLTATRDWWWAWADSPQSVAFQATDWGRLVALLPLVDGYNRLMSKAADDPRKLRAGKDVLSEIRQNESLLGATHLDRLRGRMPTGGTGARPEAVAGGVDAENVVKLFGGP
ncbi:phage terminase small subunit [Streptomyces bacillaris]|uniref:phage terminase small subunit n=1 Tax=Streptomyces bacillaris TaxID=68179 RepID=UPI003813AD52